MQHALVLPGQTAAAPLFPPETLPSYSFANVNVAAKCTAPPTGMLGDWGVATLAAVAASPCARKRWADIMGGQRLTQRLPRDCTRIEPRMFANVTPVPAAYTKVENKVRCSHCGTFHASMGRYVAMCAPEHASVL